MILQHHILRAAQRIFVGCRVVTEPCNFSVIYTQACCQNADKYTKGCTLYCRLCAVQKLVDCDTLTVRIQQPDVFKMHEKKLIDKK